MKLVINTSEDINQIENQEFIFGGPFRCMFFSNTTWDEATHSVRGSKRCRTKTTRLQQPKPCSQEMLDYMDSQGIVYPTNPYYIKHISEYNFAPLTFLDYQQILYTPTPEISEEEPEVPDEEPEIPEEEPEIPEEDLEVPEEEPIQVLTPSEVILSRIPEDPMYLEYTPQQYVEEVILEGQLVVDFPEEVFNSEDEGIAI